jgi:hypothetical protein
MLYAISHWHAGWHAIVCVGGFVLWLLSYLPRMPRMPSDGGRMEAEKRGRERIMESYDRYDRRDGDD